MHTINTDNQRVYGKEIDVSMKSIQDFYNKRASKHNSGYNTVLLADGNVDYVMQWNKREKERIMPLLGLSKESCIIDIGCGIGRWAEDLAPHCRYYMGIDFSSEMIRVAKERFKDAPHLHFTSSAFQNIYENKEINGQKYNIVIITGVSMYINDSDLEMCYSKLKDILKEEAIVYIEESVGVKERLTLNGQWSENLKDDYSAIYRTREEYVKLLQPLIKNSDVLIDEYVEDLDKKDLKETSHWNIIMRVHTTSQ